MTLDKITERTTIEFPEPLSVSETMDLFTYIGQNLHSDVSSTVENKRKVHGMFPGGKEVSNELMGVNVYGHISTVDVAGSSTFKCTTHSPEYHTLIDALVFDWEGESDLEKHRREEVTLWDKVREQVSNYFQQRES